MDLLIRPMDAAIIVAYLVATVLLGIWLGRGEKSAKGYFLGNRQLPAWALLISIVASETSTVTFLSIPGQVYAEGGNFGFLQLAFGFIIGRIAVAWLMLPGYFRGELQTSYELLATESGQGTRQLASGLFLATRTIGDALRLFLTALVLYKVIALSLPLCIVIVGLATIVYTLFGGLRAVVWNDCIQFVVYIAGACWALFVLVDAIGGWSEIIAFGQSTKRLDVVDWNPFSKRTNLWVGVIGGAFLSFATHGTDHMVVQRLLGASSLNKARMALVLSGVVVFLQFAFFLLIGLALACFFESQPPEQAFESNDEVFVSFVANELQVGVVGLVLAAVFAAAMSTQSSSLNSLSAAFVNDFYSTRKNAAEDATKLRIGKMATAVFGILQILIGIFAHLFLMENRSVIDLVFQIASFAYGPVLGLFFLAIVFRNRIRSRESLWAFSMGLILVILLKTIPLLNKEIPVIQGLWFTPIGSLATLAFGSIWRLANKNRA